jgi:hypothetical protein
MGVLAVCPGIAISNVFTMKKVLKTNKTPHNQVKMGEREARGRMEEAGEDREGG